MFTDEFAVPQIAALIHEPVLFPPSGMAPSLSEFHGCQASPRHCLLQKTFPDPIHSPLLPEAVKRHQRNTLCDEGWGHGGTHLSSLGSSASPSTNEVVFPGGFYRIVFQFTSCSHFLPPPVLHSLDIRSAVFYLLFFGVESQGIAKSTAPAALGFLPLCVSTIG